MTDKPLVIATARVNSDHTAMELIYAGRRLGKLVIGSEELDEFVSGLRQGFHTVYAPTDQQLSDIQDFVRGLVED